MRDTALALRKEHAVVRHEIYKYAVVHTGNRDKSSNAQANAKHQSSNNMAKQLFSRIPANVLHEKGLQRQIGVGTLVSSQERRALAVPLINRLSAAGQPLVNRGSTADFVPPSVYIGFRLFVLPKRHPGQCLRFAGKKKDGCLLAGPTRRRPVLPCPVRPRCHSVRRPDPTGPKCVRFLDSTGSSSANKSSH